MFPIQHCIQIRSTQGPLGRAFLKQGERCGEHAFFLLADVHIGVTVFFVMTGLNLVTASIYLGYGTLLSSFAPIMLTSRLGKIAIWMALVSLSCLFSQMSWYVRTVSCSRSSPLTSPPSF